MGGRRVGGGAGEGWGEVDKTLHGILLARN